MENKIYIENYILKNIIKYHKKINHKKTKYKKTQKER